MINSKELVKIEKYLDVQENEIIAKEKCIISLNLDDYKTLESGFDESDSTENNDNIISKIITIPGTFDIIFPEIGDYVSLFFNYNININKNRINKETSSELILEFHPGEIICYAFVKKVETDIKLLGSILENQIKYLKGRIDRQLIAAYDQIRQQKTFDMHHLETLLSQQYIDKVDDEYVPLRLTGKDYSEKYAINSKEGIHKMGNESGFTYGYVQDSLVQNISKTKSTKQSDLEMIMSGKYDELIETKGK